MNAPKKAPLEMSGAEFKRVGYALVDRVAAFLDELPSLKVTPDETPEAVRALLGAGAVPEEGRDAQAVLDRACELLFGHSLFNGHPRFFGYVNCSAAPMGALGDMLVSAIN